MMINTLNTQTELTDAARMIDKTSQTVLADNSLTPEQREDFTMIYMAATEFIRYTNSEAAIIFGDADAIEKQRVRHQLRNHLNIIVGFTGLIIKELPANLLLHMAQIREVNATAYEMLKRVDAIA